jgi:hypothetical protein
VTSPGQPAPAIPAVPAEAVTIARPRHPVPALTTFELRRYQRELEHAINGIAPDAPTWDDLRCELDGVLAEQESRTRIQHVSRKGAPGL